MDPIIVQFSPSDEFMLLGSLWMLTTIQCKISYLHYQPKKYMIVLMLSSVTLAYFILRIVNRAHVLFCQELILQTFWYRLQISSGNSSFHRYRPQLSGRAETIAQPKRTIDVKGKPGVDFVKRTRRTRTNSKSPSARTSNTNRSLKMQGRKDLFNSGF